MDRTQFQGATLSSIKSEQEKAEKALPKNESQTRPGFHSIEDGDNWRRIAPAHKPDQPAYCAKSSVVLECEVDELDKEGNPTGKKEVKKKSIFIATQHSSTLKDDPILLYISFVQKRANDEIQDKEERQKFLYPINGWRGKDGKWNWGIKPSIEYICYAWDKKGELGRETLYPYMIESMKKLSVQQSSDTSGIVPDIFTELDEGFPLIITRAKNEKTGKTETTVSCDLPSKEKRESWDEFFKRTRITDEQLIELVSKESLKDLYIDVYTMRDFEMAIDGLKRFDKQYKYGIFENEEFLEKIAQIKKQVPPYVSKEFGVPSENVEKSSESKEKPKEGLKKEFDKIPVNSNEGSALPAPIPTMKRQLTEYIKENYGDDYQLPELTREQLIEWYGLAKNGEELPFDIQEEITTERVKSDVKKEEPKVEPKQESPVNPVSKDIDPDLKAQIEKLRQRGRKQE